MKPILSDKQLGEIWDKLTAGETLDNATSRQLLQDLYHYQMLANKYEFLHRLETRIAIREARKKARAI